MRTFRKKEESSPTVTTNKSPDGIFEDSPKDNVAQQEQNVKLKSSRELETIEELRQQNEPLKKQVDYWHSAGRREKKNAPGGVKRSIEFENEASGEQRHDRMKANKQTVAQMETVASVPGYDGALKASDLIQAVSEFFYSVGNAVENEELGRVILQKRGIKDDISHGIGQEKAAAFMAVPDVLKCGKVVDYRENWKGRGYDTAIVAAPIKISGENYITGVCVKRTSGENKFYVHEVLPIKEGATPFNRAALETSVDSGGDTPSMNRILSELLYVKDNLRFSAYIGANKTGAPQLTDAQGPNVYAQNGSVVTPTEKIAQQGLNVNQKHSRELETVEELRQQNELLKKQVDYWHSTGRRAKKERPWGREAVDCV